MDECIFCKIVSGDATSHKVWEDGKYLAFLSIFPNTKGITVVIPKQHVGSYIFDADTTVMQEMMSASKKAAKILDNYFEDVGRTGIIFEGFGVNHLHAKLIPMHGTNIKEWKPIRSNMNTYFDKYEGYLSSHDSERVSDSELSQLASDIRKSSS